MASKISLQQFKGLFLIKGIFALLLAAPDVASAAIKIKDTNYPIPSGAYFVSPNGKATNSGKSPDSPWPVALALAKAPRGSTIIFRGGTYRNVKANINKKLTLQAYPHSKAWLKGSIEVHGWVREGNKWRFDGWKHSFPPNMSRKYIDRKYPLAGHRDMVYINGVSLKQVASKALVEPGAFFVDYAKHKLYIGNNPAGKTVEATALTRAFGLWQGGKSNPRGTVVRGLGFAHYAIMGINVQAPGVTLENNTFAWNGVQGVCFAGNAVRTDAIVRGNTFTHNGRVGLEVDSADRMLLENNTISYNNVERFAKTWAAAGVKVTKTDRMILRNNRVEKNFATGMWLDHSTTDATIVSNTSRYNKSIGIQLELSDRAIIAGNLVTNNGAGIMIADSSNARVYNNTLAKNKDHIIVKDSPRKNTNRAEIARGITWITRNNVFKNNILSYGRNKSLFVNEAHGDYRLKQGSPAIGRGEALPKDIAQAIGLPARVPVDLGALQSKIVLLE